MNYNIIGKLKIEKYSVAVMGIKYGFE